MAPDAELLTILDELKKKLTNQNAQIAQYYDQFIDQILTRQRGKDWAAKAQAAKDQPEKPPAPPRDF